MPRQFLPPTDDTASRALVDVQTATTRVKELVTEGVTKGWDESELTKRLNAAIAEECARVDDAGLREQMRKALVTSARKWHYELKMTYRVLDSNLAQQASRQPLGIDVNDLLRKTPYEKMVEFRKVLDDGTNPGIPIIKDYQRSVKIAIRAMSAEPPKINTSGRSVPLRLRAEMAVRYSAAVENLQRLAESGARFCWISSHASCSPRCAPYQGQLYSLDGTSGTVDGIPFKPIAVALAGPNGDGNGCISGYNCRHRAVEYEKGSRPPQDYSEAEMKREYAVDQQQRKYENQIRQLKTEERLARASGDLKEAAKLRKQWQSLTLQYQIYSVEHDRAFYPYRCVIDRAEIPDALTASDESDTIVNENTVQAVGDYAPLLKEAVQNAQPIVRDAIKRYSGELKVADAHYVAGKDEPKAYFSPTDGGIHFNVDADAQPSDKRRKQFRTYFHETGHALDHIIGQKIGGLYASVTYRSTAHDNMTLDEMIQVEGRQFLEGYREQLRDKLGGNITDRMVYRAILEDFIGVDLADRRQLSDILDGITDGEMQRTDNGLGTSHTKFEPDYWKRVSVGEEAFAHFTDVSATNPKTLEFFMNYFGKSYEIYQEIMSYGESRGIQRKSSQVS